MSSTERRQAIISVLIDRREDTMSNLAAEFGVTRRTIIGDIEELSLSYPIETAKGRYGGGVKVADWYRPSRRTLASEQIDAIRKAAQFLEGKDRRALMSVLSQFTAP